MDIAAFDVSRFYPWSMLLTHCHWYLTPLPWGNSRSVWVILIILTGEITDAFITSFRVHATQLFRSNSKLIYIVDWTEQSLQTTDTQLSAPTLFTSFSYPDRRCRWGKSAVYKMVVWCIEFWCYVLVLYIFSKIHNTNQNR